MPENVTQPTDLEPPEEFAGTPICVDSNPP